VESIINIAPQADVTHSFTGELKGVSLKDYHVLVYTDVLNNIYESSDSNNIAPSLEKLKVTVPQLPINVLTQRSINNKKEVYYRVVVPDSLVGESLLITLKGDSLQGANEIYLRYADVPTRAVYDFAHALPYQGNQEVVVPELKGGTYYLMVYGNTTSGIQQPISLLARILNFEIRNVQSGKGGNTGSVTVQIIGSKLGSVNAIQLVAGSITITADSVRIVDPTKVFATFNLAGATLGSYDVVAQNTKGETATLKNGFTIVTGVAPNLLTNVVTPPSTRPSSIISIEVQYTNAGNTDIVNPVLKLGSLGGAPIAFTVADLEKNTKELTLSLKELNGPEGVLRPGASGTIIVYSKAMTALTFMLVQSLDEANK
jgi:hypothetical protein